jgi:phage terminase large subunit
MSDLATSGESFSIDEGSGQMDLDWVFWDKQLEALAALDSGEHDIIVFRGGFGSGKTILGARATLRAGLNVPKSDNLILAPDSQKGGPATYKKFFETLPGKDTVPDEGGDAENSPVVIEHNQNDSRVTLFNGSVVRLGSADKWNRYAGSEFNWIWGDEVAHYDNTNLFKLNEMLVSRQRTSEGPNVTLWTSTGNGYNDFWQFVELQELPSGEPLPTKIENIVADSRDNPFLDEKEKLVRQFEDTNREEEALKGGFAAAEGLVYNRFSRPLHVIPAERAQKIAVGDWRIYGYDHGWGDPRVVVEIGRTVADQYVVLDHFYRFETQPEEAIEWLKLNEKPKGKIYAEHMPEHIEKFKAAGYDAEAAIKDLDEGIEFVQGLLKTDNQGNPGMFVSEECIDLIREFMSYKEEHVGKNSAEDHALDSYRYGVFSHEYENDGGGITKSTRSGASTGRSYRSRNQRSSRRTR